MKSSNRPPLHWGEHQLKFDEWQRLDQLWLQLVDHDGEFGISYCYATSIPHSSYLEFSDMSDMRYPIQGALATQQRLSTRPVVARPNQPLHLPAEASTTLYVGTNLWFCVNRGDDTLLDIPVARLSDTWFGPDTQTGEVCYACQTKARRSMEGVRANPYKAITPIEIRNQDSTPLLIDRINIPVPNLTLYRGEDRCWTSALSITRGSAGQAGEVQVDAGPPPGCEADSILSEARKPLDDGILRKAIHLLIG